MVISIGRASAPLRNDPRPATKETRAPPASWREVWRLPPRRPEPLDDLIQVASLGLVKALDGFDPERGESFSAYAAPTILGGFAASETGSGSCACRGLRSERWLYGRRRRRSSMAGQDSNHLPDHRRLELSEDEVLETFVADSARRTLSLDAPEQRG
jgi:RNA polymerase sigma-B factor